ncbi:hypothetical protein BDP27DRAFT_1425219 [Rhodocollybia butyracea]|uniref:Uncharacterized protein n=1 Tax=Rhodocollybia butyracea TaxID=206335 RepID=A0A9P5U3Z1_9AGAR|nr:hypothetical protein BDP27DRAFT_1425219 [Rhodocollybia butyracea]
MAYLSEPLSPLSFSILSTTGLAHLFSADSGPLASNKPFRLEISLPRNSSMFYSTIYLPSDDTYRDSNITERVSNENIQVEDQNTLLKNATEPLKLEKVPAKALPVDYVEAEEEQLRENIDKTLSKNFLQSHADLVAECFSTGRANYSTSSCLPTEIPKTLAALVLLLNSAIATASVSFSIVLPSLLRTLQNDTATKTGLASFRHLVAILSGHKIMYRAFQAVLSRWCLKQIYRNDTAALVAQESLLRCVGQVVFDIRTSMGQLAHPNEVDLFARFIQGIGSFPHSLVPGLVKIVDYCSALSSCIKTTQSQPTDAEIFLPEAGDTFDSEEMLELSLTIDPVWEGNHRREVMYACELGLRKAGKILLKSGVQSCPAQAP